MSLSVLYKNFNGFYNTKSQDLFNKIKSMFIFRNMQLHFYKTLTIVFTTKSFYTAK